jgi:predicted Rossmann-fold nucleotide-binding protein
MCRDKRRAIKAMTDESNQAMPDDDGGRVPSRPLRVCCYGSSSSRTPSRYTDAAYRLGRALALRGHTCVNGAGSSGCMDAMNVGANDAGGRIVGVIHEMFVREGGDWFEGTSSVFRPSSEGGDGGGGTTTTTDGGGGVHEIVIARGNDLQERKRLLVEGADALAVLPGGPGTWDEVR